MMDIYDEIPCKIWVIESGRLVKSHKVNQMAKTYREFIRILKEKEIEFVQLEYLDSNEDWKAMNSEDDYQEAATYSTAQTFHARVYTDDSYKKFQTNSEEYMYDRQDGQSVYQSGIDKEPTSASCSETSLNSNSSGKAVFKNDEKPKSKSIWTCAICSAKNQPETEVCSACNRKR